MSCNAAGIRLSAFRLRSRITLPSGIGSISVGTRDTRTAVVAAITCVAVSSDDAGIALTGVAPDVVTLAVSVVPTARHAISVKAYAVFVARPPVVAIAVVTTAVVADVDRVVHMNGRASIPPAVMVVATVVGVVVMAVMQHVQAV